MALLPSQVADLLTVLQQVKGQWFDNNPLAPEYIFPANWSPWDWVQFGGLSAIPRPLQENFNSIPTTNYKGPFTFLAKVEGKYEVYIDKKTSPGKPAVNTALYAKQNEIKIRLYLITPYDLVCVKLLLQWACAIFPADKIAGKGTVVPVYHPKLTLFERHRFILVSMTYPDEPREGHPAYVDTVWLPSDLLAANQNQVATFTGLDSVANATASTAPGAAPPTPSNPGGLAP